MELSLDEIVNWIFTLSAVSIYTFFFVIAYLENVIPPIPGDLLVAFGGFLAAEQIVGFTHLLWITTVASVLGFMTMYAIGSFWGYRIDDRESSIWFVRWINTTYYRRGRRWMRRWGQWVILLNRFLAGMRSVIALTAGIYRTRIRRTVMNSSISSLLWNSILLALGWFVHENWQVIGDYLSLYGWTIFGVIGAILLVLFLRKRSGKRKRDKGGRNSHGRVDKKADSF